MKGLKYYSCLVAEDREEKITWYFLCWAENKTHAKEQALNESSVHHIMHIIVKDDVQ